MRLFFFPFCSQIWVAEAYFFSWLVQLLCDILCFIKLVLGNSLSIIMDKGDIIPVNLMGKKYMSRSFHLKNFVGGKGLVGYLVEQPPRPTITGAVVALLPNQLMTRQLHHGTKTMAKLSPGFSTRWNCLFPSSFRPFQRLWICGIILRNCITR